MNFLDYIFPKQCVSCGRLGRYVCVNCQKQIVPIALNECICPVCEEPAIAGMTHPKCHTRYSLDGLTSFFYYKDVIQKLITSIKYSFVRSMATELVSYIPFGGYELYSVYGNICAILLPVPLHPSRLRFRGFNQSDLLGRMIASSLHIHYSAEILKRILPTKAQVSMAYRHDRLSNVHGAFRITTALDPDIRHYMIFDDVFTTGATLREAASELKHHGATSVWGVTLAR